MATVSTIQSDACVSGIGKIGDPIGLMRIIAQTSADYLKAAYPSSDISVAAIQSRACASGIGKVTDPDDLLRIIAQLLLDQQG